MKLNRRQLCSLWLGVLLILLSGAFPPYDQTVKGLGIRITMPSEFAGYYFIGAPPTSQVVEGPAIKAYTIDVTRLAIQVLAALVLMLGLIISFAEGKSQLDSRNDDIRKLKKRVKALEGDLHFWETEYETLERGRRPTDANDPIDRSASCPTCGASISDHCMYCSGCGTKIAGSATASTDSRPQKQTAAYEWEIMVVIVAFIWLVSFAAASDAGHRYAGVVPTAGMLLVLVYAALTDRGGWHWAIRTSWVFGCCLIHGALYLPLRIVFDPSLASVAAATPVVVWALSRSRTFVKAIDCPVMSVKNS